MTKLYYISTTHEDGEDLSLFVEAEGVLEAVDHWIRWCAAEMELVADLDDYFVFELPPLSGAPKTLMWHKDVREVG